LDECFPLTIFSVLEGEAGGVLGRQLVSHSLRLQEKSVSVGMTNFPIFNDIEGYTRYNCRQASGNYKRAVVNTRHIPKKM
jgi:methyl coenzyme M reductase gamma subunit